MSVDSSHSRWASTARRTGLAGSGYSAAALMKAQPRNVELGGIDQAAAEQLVEAAHQVCPYSNATRGNVPVTLETVTA